MAWWLNSDALSSPIIKGRADYYWERVSFNTKKKQKQKEKEEKSDVGRGTKSKPTNQIYVINCEFFGGILL